jgi:hypothetical protein
MLAFDAGEQRLAFGALGQEQHGGFREGPLQIGIADLGAAAAHDLAGRALLALHQPAVGGELLDAREASNVVDLIQDRQRQDVANPRQRPQQLEAVIGSTVDRLHRAVPEGAELGILVEPDGDHHSASKRGGRLLSVSPEQPVSPLKGRQVLA